MAFYFDNYGFYKISGGGPDPDRNIYIAQWDNTFTYVTDSIVAYDGSFYKSLVDDNLNNTPDTSPLSWEEVTGDVSDPYYADFVIADWLPDGSGGFYIDYPAVTHQQTQSKHVYAFISHNTVDPDEFIPFAYGDFMQHDNGDIRILSDIAFDGYIAITSFFVTGATPAGDYSLLLNKPILNTDNALALTPDVSETINGTIELHKISKTGDYDDLLNKPTNPILNTDNNSTLPINNSESITGTIDLYKVAKTGYYDDLLEKPMLPTTFYPMLNSNKITKNVKYERNPSIYEDTNGILYLWYVRANTLDVRTGGDVDSEMYKVYYQTSSDGGATWETPVLLPETLPVTFSPRELSFMQDDLGLYHLFISNGCNGSPSDDRLMHHFTTSDLITWTNENPIVITGWTSNPAQIGHAQVIFANSQFYMAFQQRSNSSVYFAKSADGNTWTYVTLFTGTYLIPKICFKAGVPNKLFIVSTKGSAINLGVSIDDGATWNTSDVITHASSWDPMIMTYPNGNLLIVFAPGIGSDGQQLKSSVSTDDGVTWSDLTTLTDGKKGTYEWWDYWPFAYNNGNETYVYYSSEYDSAGRSILPGEIQVMKIDDYIVKASKVENDSSVVGDTVKDALENLTVIPQGINYGVIHVDGSRVDSYTEDGSIYFPYKTIQSAIDSGIASGRERLDIKVAPKDGNYVENLSFIYGNYLRIDLESSHIVGNINWIIPSTVSIYKAKFIICGNDARAAYPISVAYHLNGVQGDITIDQTGVTTSKYVGLHIINSGVVGNIIYTSGSGSLLSHIFLINSVYTGDIISTEVIGATAILYAMNNGFSSSASCGGMIGRVVPYYIMNVTFTRPLLLSTPAGGGGGNWYNVKFKSGSNFNYNSLPYSGSIKTDANSYASYYTNVVTKGNETITLLDEAKGVKNDSSVTGISVKDALETLDTNKVNGTGISNTFTTVDLKTVTVVNGVITSIV